MAPTDTGWTRRRAGRGFTYLDESGVPVSAEHAARIKALAIPPAWQEVWICAVVNGHIQAVGTDARGRRQYLYHPEWRAKRDLLKYDHVLAVARRLPAARSRVTDALALGGMPLERAMATAFRLLDLGYFRIGSDTYADENGSYGLTTLERQHVTRQGTRLLFEFVAKSGVTQQIEIADPVVLASVETMRRRRGGSTLLAYRDVRSWAPISATEVNDYLRDLLGAEMTAKDFRTWHGSVHASVALARLPAQTQPARKRAVAQAMRQVAEHLGNTPTVARASYVDQRIIDLYYDGVTIERAVGTADKLRARDPRRQEILERAVVRILAR
ncbi:MAG: DNA topoisomerase IB [Jatrophihabitans sp.]